jgi:hypothetical protein
MNDKKEPTVFDRYVPTPPKLTIIEGGNSKSGKQPYTACRVDERHRRSVQIRLELHDKDGTTCSLSRAYLVEWVASADQYLTLIFTTSTFSIEGKNLTDMLETLDNDHMNITLCAFNPRLHIEPDEREPVITHIRRRA